MFSTNTQTCRQCKTEKATTEFHRRGSGFVKCCKSCISENGKIRYKLRGRKRKQRPADKESRIVTQAGLGEMSERIKALEPALRSLASRYSNGAIDSDDIFQVIVESILKKCTPDKTNGFIFGCARFAAKELLRQKDTYNFYVAEISQDDETEGQIQKVSHLIENEIIQNEISTELQSIISRLSPEYQQVIALLSFGYNQAEISKSLHLSEQAVSAKMKLIRKGMMTMGFGPASQVY